jgi:multidrug efflux system membrane fusion protein
LKTEPKRTIGDPMTTSSLTLSEPEVPVRPRRRLLWVVMLVGAVTAGALFWRVRAMSAGERRPAAGERGPAGPGGRAGAEARPVPVATAPVVRRDVPVFLDGLGTVAAYKTVTVRSRVDGQLQTVAFREGQAVKRGTLLAEIDPRPFLIQLHQAEAALARDNAQLRGSQLNLERYAAVRKDKLIAQQQVDDQRASVEQLEATVKSDEAQVESAKLLLDYARITSPIDGVTGVRLVDPGNMVRATDASGLVIVAQLDPIAVLFTLPQDYLPMVASEMGKGSLTVYAFSRDGRTDLGKGTVEVIDNQINATTSTIRLKAIFANPGHTLWPNQFVKARLHARTRAGALVVPAVAVQRGPRGSYAYVIGADQKAAMRAVTVETIDGEVAIISEGLQEGEQVVVDGQSQLRPGAPVLAKGPTGDGGRGAGGERGAGRPGRRP